MIGKSKWSVGTLMAALVSVTLCLALFGSPTVAYGQPGWAARDKAAEGKDAKATKDHPAGFDSRNSPVREPVQTRQQAPVRVQERSWNSIRSDRAPVASSQRKFSREVTSSSAPRPGGSDSNRDSQIPARRQSGWMPNNRAPSASGEQPSTRGGATQLERRAGWGSGDSRTTLPSGTRPGWGRGDRVPPGTTERRSGWGSGDSKTTLPSGTRPGWGRDDRVPPGTTERRAGWGNSDSRTTLPSGTRPGWGSGRQPGAATDRTPADSNTGWAAPHRPGTAGATGWAGMVTPRDAQPRQRLDVEQRLPTAPVAPARQRTITVETGWRGRVHNEVRRVPEPLSGWSAARQSAFSVGLDIRHQNTSLWFSFSSYRDHWGDPGYFYHYRPYGDYGKAVSIHYYYPCYYYRPGPVFFDPYRPYHGCYYPAPFCSYGWFSFWLPASVVIIERPVVVTDSYWFDDSDYRDDYSVPDSARNAMSDIRDAWLDNRPELIQDHLQQYGKIRIYFQGRYAYSINGEDYYQMVQDAFSTLETERFDLGRMRARSRDEIFISARHEFVDPDGGSRTVQLGYTLRRSNGTWYIVAVDSSSRYLEIRDNQYRDD